jgi:hypothetical protein
MTVQRLALLVGSNPLPNLLTAMTLRPEEVRLVYSAQTDAPKKRLAALIERTVQATVSDYFVSNAADARTVADTCAAALEGVDHLNYTGGTKVMAVHARMVFGALGQSNETASYVDEAADCLRRDDGLQIPIQCSTITLDDTFELHGLERPIPRDAGASQAILTEVENIVNEIFADPVSTKELYPSRGDWLEEWIAQQLRDLYSNLAVRTGVKSKTGGKQFESDVVFLRGHRLHVVECTTQSRQPACKGTLFEAALRARQIGGDLARYALVSFLSKDDASEVQRNVDAVWGSPVKPKVFGIDHLREWAGVGREAPDRRSLVRWVEQTS